MTPAPSAQRPTIGRPGYVIGAALACAFILFTPWLASELSVFFAGDAADFGAGILRGMIRAFVMQCGIVIGGLVLAVVASRRLRDIGLSTAWLVLFPLAPLQTIFNFASAAGPSLIAAQNSPLFTAPLWIELAFGIALACLPARTGDGALHFMNRLAPPDATIEIGRAHV